MAVDTKKYSHRLRQLCEEYYRNNISYSEFRNARDRIFDSIDEDQGMLEVKQEENFGQEHEDVVGMDVDLTH